MATQPNSAGTLAILARQKAARAGAALALGVTQQPVGGMPMKRVVPATPPTLEPPKDQDMMEAVRSFLGGFGANTGRNS